MDLEVCQRKLCIYRYNYEHVQLNVPSNFINTRFLPHIMHNVIKDILHLINNVIHIKAY